MTRLRSALLAVLLGLAAAPLSAQSPDSLVAPYRPVADRIIRTALADSSAWRRLAELVDRFGHRLSGSESLEHAIDWVLVEMQRDGLDRAMTEPVKVPHWVRGRESAELIEPRDRKSVV